MLPTTDKSHRDFFRKNGAIAFEGLVDEQQLAQLESEIDKVLKQRRAASRTPQPPSSRSDYLLGHDLWRGSPQIKQLVCQKKWGRIAAELLDLPSLRLGFDQLYTAQVSYPWKTPTLRESCSLEGVVGGVVIPLSELPLEAMPFNGSRGSLLFFKEGLPLPLELLEAGEGQRFLLVAYTLPTALYMPQELDPHTHTLKGVGYVFGDRLREELNPLICK